MRRDWLGSLGLTLVCVAAVVASFSTLASLAAVAGWGQSASWLLPVCLDALGMVACRVWLSEKAPALARKFAKRTALATVAVSIVGNAAGHLATTGHLSQGLVLVVLVGAVPPAGLAAGIHLAVLRGKVSVPDATPVPAEKPKAVVKPEAKKAVPKKAAPSPDETVDDFDMQRARHANRDYGAENAGKTITRDALKAALAPCGTTKATALLAALKKEREAA